VQVQISLFASQKPWGKLRKAISLRSIEKAKAMKVLLLAL